MSYDATKIEVLSGLEAIRRRPEMYAGRLDDPALFNRFIQEALCLAIDEAVNGYCTRIQVSVFPDWSVTVRDNGRGLSMLPDALGWIPAEIMFTKLHACRQSKENSRLKQSCCGMGIVVVNALSQRFRVRNFREGVCWIQVYQYGEALAPFQRESDTAETGLELSFQPDLSIVSGLHFDEQALIYWMSTMELQFETPTVTRDTGSEYPTVLLFERTLAVTASGV